jgi:hypothetical protein
MAAVELSGVKLDMRLRLRDRFDHGVAITGVRDRL